MVIRAGQDLTDASQLGPDTRPGLEEIPLTRPTVPDPGALAEDLAKIMASGVLTNGPYVRELESRAADYLGVRHCVAVASCTAGLMLVLRVSELSGDVIVPSFTFAATAHAVAWNGLRPIFADIEPKTLTLAPDAVERSVGVRTSAILATHLYGTPCDVDGLGELANKHGLHLFFDAAHAFGSLHSGIPVGRFGDAEIFSLSPTKVVVAGEGGLIATNDDRLAERCRIGRDYGNPGDYDCQFVGLNARMSEVNAAMGLASLQGIDERIERRNALANIYRAELRGLPGLTFPSVPEGHRSTFKDFTIVVDPDVFSMNAESLAGALAAIGIDTRRYYAPPVHAMRAYRTLNGGTLSLPVTEEMAAKVLTLPMWSEMADAQVMRVADGIRRIHKRVGGIRNPE